MKERLRELGIKTTELSGYMKISRPSLYKYIELYESGDRKAIPEKVLRVFRYVDKYSRLSREQVIAFTISEFADSDTSDKKEAIRGYLLKKGADDPKIDLMYMLITTDYLDALIPYLSNSARILSEGDPDDDQLYQVARLVNLRCDVMNGMPLDDEEKERARRNIHG